MNKINIMRKSKIYYEIKRLLKSDRTLSDKKKVDLLSRVNSIMLDLEGFHCAINRLDDLSRVDFNELVTYWHDRHITKKTIYNKFWVLNTLFKIKKLDVELPPIQFERYGLKPRISEEKLLIIQETLRYEPTIYFINLQFYFGLCEKEITYLDVEKNIMDYAIRIDRSIAFNSTERTIEARTENQKKIITTLHDKALNFTCKKNLAVIKAEREFWDLCDYNFRRSFGHYLTSNLSKMDKSCKLEILRKELGLRTTRVANEYYE